MAALGLEMKSGMLFAEGSKDADLSSDDLRRGIRAALEELQQQKPRERVLVLPPDYTRVHSRAGELTQMVDEYYGDRVTDIMPALGTHQPMSADQLSRMFGPVSSSKFRVHDWRNDVVQVFEI